MKATKPLVLKIKAKPLVLAMQITGQNNQRRRGQFSFYCERNGADFNHWPFQCTLLNQILSDWHADQNATGHQSQS